MDIFLHNTMTGKKEKFSPLKAGEVSMYNCGPTVYDYAHIGNFRTFVLSDLLRRMFEYNTYDVQQVMNITDVDDKTIKRSIAENVSLKELTTKYEDLFFKDLESLNIPKPSKTPRATESITDMIALIETLLTKEVAYKSSDGIYFNISKAKNYGALAHLNLENITKERIANDEYDKENPRDFSLWKFHTPEDGDIFYDAPFGKGRPGWHIECSAMSKKCIGETIDIHTGGSDLIFPHHTNEIAQSESANDKPFVHYWMHGGFLTIDGKKMSKSLGNIFTLETLREKNIDPLAYRYFVLGAHYSTLLNFTWEALEGAQTAWKKLRARVQNLSNIDAQNTDSEEIYTKLFNESINNDLNMPIALALVWEILKDEKISDIKKKELILNFDRILGLRLDEPEETIEIPEDVKLLITLRDKARTEKDFAKSDEIRAEIEKLGFEVSDTPEGTEVAKK